MSTGRGIAGLTRTAEAHDVLELLNLPVDDFGNTALHNAAFDESIDDVLNLLGKRADVNVTNHDNATPLHKVIAKKVMSSDCKRIAQALLTPDANVNIKNVFGQTPLFLATCCGHKEIAMLLLQRKADVNLTDMDGDTPLSMAAKNGQVIMANLLLDSAIIPHSAHTLNKAIDDARYHGRSNVKAKDGEAFEGLLTRMQSLYEARRKEGHEMEDPSPAGCGAGAGAAGINDSDVVSGFFTLRVATKSAAREL